MKKMYFFVLLFLMNVFCYGQSYYFNGIEIDNTTPAFIISSTMNNHLSVKIDNGGEMDDLKMVDIKPIRFENTDTNIAIFSNNSDPNSADIPDVCSTTVDDGCALCSTESPDFYFEDFSDGCGNDVFQEEIETGAFVIEAGSLLPGTYEIVIEYAIQGSGINTSQIITLIIQDCDLMINPSAIDESCTDACNGSVWGFNEILNGVEPYEFHWEGEGLSWDYPDRNWLCQGDYCLTVTDANGCTAEDCLTLGVGTVNPTGVPCNDFDSCTENDALDANCNCVGTLVDSDGDGICDNVDQCEGFDDSIDNDFDGIPDGCDDNLFKFNGQVVNQFLIVSILATNLNEITVRYDNGGLMPDLKSLQLSNPSADLPICEKTPNEGCGCSNNSATYFVDYNSSSCGDQGEFEIIQNDDGTTTNINTATGDEEDEGLFVITENSLALGDYSVVLFGDSESNPSPVFTLRVLADSDGDGISDEADICPGYDDNLDSDNDGIPDGCDPTNSNDPSCDDVVVETSDNFIFISGLTAPIEIVKIFNEDWQSVFNCSNNCGGAAVIDNLSEGTYYVKVKMYTASWETICELTQYIEVGGIGSCDDSDNDGICDADDICAGYDDNVDTDGDGIPDGCDEPDPSDPECPEVTFLIEESSVTISGLTAPIEIVKIFNEDWQLIFNCNNNCGQTEIINDLEDGTYNISIKMYTANWSSICEVSQYVIVGELDTTEPEPDPDCDDINISTTNSSISLTGLNAPIEIVKLFNSDWEIVFECFDDCGKQQNISDLDPGTYYVSVKMYTLSWDIICAYTDYVTLGDYVPSISSSAQFLHFNAERSKRSVELNWVTNTEFNNDMFVIERSVDGNNFESLNEVKSISEELAPIYYAEMDQEPMIGFNYYRLKQIHHDGTFRYSEIRKVIFDIDLFELVLFPNPVAEDLFVNIKEFEGRKATINVYNNLGKRMMQRSIDEINSYSEKIDVNNYEAGLYYLTIKIEGVKMRSRSFMVQRL